MADKSNASGSDSESSLTDWTVVDGHGDIEVDAFLYFYST